MTILEALIQLRDDLKLWCINNFNHKLNKNLGTEENGKFLTVDSKGDIVTTSNYGVRSVSTGSSNGTISVNTNGSSANVAVKGLGSAAYTASTAYDAAGTAQTKANAALASAKAYTDSLIDGLTAEGDANAGVVQAALNAHKEDKNNPHGVTCSQIGAAAASHNHAATDINSGTLSSDRLPTVPVAKGGTGSTNGATGLKNLFAAGKTVLSSHQYGASFPSSPADGTIFFKESSGGIDEVSDSLVRELMLKAYPVGSLYVSRNAASPASLFGGTWTQIKDAFLLAAGDTYSIGSTGGSATVTLTEAQMPSHYHRAWVKDFLGQTYDKTSPAWTAVLKNDSVQYNYATGLTSSETVALTEAKGGNEAHSNMPPYLAVYVWERTA